MTGTQEKDRKGVKRVATFTAMSIDAALVFPHSLSTFLQVPL